MNADNPAQTAYLPADWRDFFALTKPRVMTLVIFTAICGLLAAPGSIHPVLGFTAILCVALGAGGSAALNQWHEADIDAGMKRTAQRPLPAGRMERDSALQFGLGLSALSVFVMGVAINWLSAAVLAFSIFFYAVVYTIWLKPRTPQNIVIGGAAGAFPPLIGWAAVTNDITLMPVLLLLIIFVWTPPHFWALALFVQTDYARVGIPMMPVVRGEKSTRRQIFVYALILGAVAVLPWPLGFTGSVYGIGAALLSALFLLFSAQVGFRTSTGEGDAMTPEKRLFFYSILYLFALFTLLVLDAILLSRGVIA